MVVSSKGHPISQANIKSAIKKGERPLTSGLMRDFVHQEDIPTHKNEYNDLPLTFDVSKSDTNTIFTEALKKNKETAHIINLKRQELHSFLYRSSKSSKLRKDIKPDQFG